MQQAESPLGVRGWYCIESSILRFTKFVALIIRDFFKSTGQNVTKYTSFERIFNLAPHDAIPYENNSLLTIFSAKMTFSHVKCSGFKAKKYLNHR